MVSPPQTSNLLEPCPTTSINQPESLLPPLENLPDLKAVSKTVTFYGWRHARGKFKPWADKMASIHKAIWDKAGIYEAVKASTHKIKVNKELVLGMTEKWNSDTKSFIFPWAETSITLEDVKLLLGFSVLGSPVFTAIDASGHEIMNRLETEWEKIMIGKSYVTEKDWVERFSDKNDDGFEHVAFLVCWLSYFVFPLRYHRIYEAVFPIAVHLSLGTKIALAPAVLGHLYADLNLLNKHIKGFSEESSVTVKSNPSALFKLVQLWTWERFNLLQPKPNVLPDGEPRIALWDKKERPYDDVRGILGNYKIESFIWRPYTVPLKGWEIPRFYPEEGMFLPAGSSLDEEYISFARFINPSPLVRFSELGIDFLESYFPHRVVSQFGITQYVPRIVTFNKPSEEEAWDSYNKAMDWNLYIPSRYEEGRVSTEFCAWWNDWYKEFLSSKALEKKRSMWMTEAGTSGVPSGTKEKEFTSEDLSNISKELSLRRKRRAGMMLAHRKNSMEHSRTVPVASDNDQMVRQKKKSKYIEGDGSGPCTELTLRSGYGDEAAPPPDKTEEMNSDPVLVLDVQAGPPQKLAPGDNALMNQSAASPVVNPFLISRSFVVDPVHNVQADPSTGGINVHKSLLPDDGDMRSEEETMESSEDDEDSYEKGV